MSKELFWLTLTVGMTGLFWVPYMLERFITVGIMETLDYPQPNTPAQSAWAERMRSAHSNAVQNLVVFAPLVLIVQIVGANSGTTAIACAVYFWARLAHFIVYALKIPVLRTVLFLIGWLAQVVLFFAII